MYLVSILIIKILKLKKNISENPDVENQNLKKIKNKKLFNIQNPKEIKNSNIIIFCLPTPLKNKTEPDLSFIKNAFNSIKNYLSPNTILILESTVYPGATREIFENYINKNLKLHDNIEYSIKRISLVKLMKIYKKKYEDITKISQ